MQKASAQCVFGKPATMRLCLVRYPQVFVTGKSGVVDIVLFQNAREAPAKRPAPPV